MSRPAGRPHTLLCPPPPHNACCLGSLPRSSASPNSPPPITCLPIRAVQLHVDVNGWRAVPDASRQISESDLEPARPPVDSSSPSPEVCCQVPAPCPCRASRRSSITTKSASASATASAAASPRERSTNRRQQKETFIDPDIVRPSPQTARCFVTVTRPRQSPSGSSHLAAGGETRDSGLANPHNIDGIDPKPKADSMAPYVLGGPTLRMSGELRLLYLSLLPSLCRCAVYMLYMGTFPRPPACRCHPMGRFTRPSAYPSTRHETRVRFVSSHPRSDLLHLSTYIVSPAVHALVRWKASSEGAVQHCMSQARGLPLGCCTCQRLPLTCTTTCIVLNVGASVCSGRRESTQDERRIADGRPETPSDADWIVRIPRLATGAIKIA